MKQRSKRVIGLLLVLAMTVTGIPAYAANPAAAGRGQEAEAAESGAPQSEKGDSIADKGIGDYTARDEYIDDLDIVYVDGEEHVNEPLYASSYTITYVREDGAATVADAQEIITKAGNRNISLGEDGVVSQVFDKDAEDALAPLVYSMEGMGADPDQPWKVIYRKYHPGGGSGGSGYYSNATAYLKPDTKVKDIQQYADSSGQLKVYPNWVKITAHPVIFDEKSLKGAVNVNSDITDYKPGTDVVLKPLEAAGKNWIFKGYEYAFGQKERSEAVSTDDGFLIQTTGQSETLTVYAVWTPTHSLYSISCSSIEDTKGGYYSEKDGAALISALKENASLQLTIEEKVEESDTVRKIEDSDWNGAVWFIYDKNDIPSTEGMDLAALRADENWSEITQDTKPDAGTHTVALAFDIDRYGKDSDIIAAGPVTFGKLTIDKMTVRLKLTGKDGTSDTISLKVGTRFRPDQFFDLWVYDPLGNKIGCLPKYTLRSSFSVLTHYPSDEEIEDDYKVWFNKPNVEPGNRFYAVTEASKENVWTIADLNGKALNKDNYNLSSYRLNEMRVNVYDPAGLTLFLSGGPQRWYFFVPNDEFIDGLTTERMKNDFLNVYVKGAMKNTKVRWVSFDKAVYEEETITGKNYEFGDGSDLIFALVPEDIPKEKRKEEFEKIFKDKTSLPDQLKAIARRDPTLLYARKKLYVAAMDTALGISSEDLEDSYISIMPQPIILANAEQINGIEGMGFQKKSGGVDSKGEYVGKVKVGLIDQNGDVILEDNPDPDLHVSTVRDYSGRFTYVMGALDFSDYDFWNAHRPMEIKIPLKGNTQEWSHLHGDEPISLSAEMFNYIVKDKCNNNFELFKNQNYSIYHIIDTQKICFFDMDGKLLKESGNIETGDGETVYEVPAFDGVDGTKLSTENAIWYTVDTENGVNRFRLFDGKVEPLPAKGSDDKFVGARFTLDLKRKDYGDPIKLYADFGHHETAADAKDSDFYVEYIPSVVHAVDAFVASDDNKKNSTEGNTGSLVVNVFYGRKNPKRLEFGKDYTLTYANNKKVADRNSSKAPQVTVTGKGDYKGKKAVAHFSIISPDFGRNHVIRVTKREVKYTGSPLVKKVEMTLKRRNAGVSLKNNLYEILLYEYVLDRNGVITAKLPAGSYDKNDSKIRYFDVVVVSKGGTDNRDGEICGEGLQIGENLFEAMNRDPLSVDVIGVPSYGYTPTVTIPATRSFQPGKTPSYLIKLKSLTAKYSKTTISGTDKRLNVELYQDVDGNLVYLCGKDQWETYPIEKAGNYIVKIGPYLQNGESSCASFGGYSCVDKKVALNPKKIKSSDIKLAEKNFSYSDNGPVLTFTVKDTVKKENIEVCILSDDRNALYTAGEGKLTFCDGSIVGKPIPIVINGKNLTLADCEKGLKVLDVEKATGYDMRSVGTHYIIVRGNGGDHDGEELKLTYTIK